MKALLPIALAVVLSPATALADQCAWLDAATAERAREVVARHPHVLLYCEPCGTARGEPYTVTEATLRAPAAGYTELVLDGEPVDLAYTFVETAPGRFANLAKLAGCEAHGVSARLELEARPAPAPCPAPTLAPVAPPPAVSAPVSVSATPPPVFITAVLTRSIDGFVVGLAWLGGTLAGIAGMLGMMLARRRHAMRPRALELPPR